MEAWKSQESGLWLEICCFGLYDRALMICERIRLCHEFFVTNVFCMTGG